MPLLVRARWSSMLTLASVLATTLDSRAQGVIDDREVPQQFGFWWDLNCTTWLPRPRLDPAALASAREKAIPALTAALRESTDDDLTTSAMLALARIVPPSASLDLTALFRSRLGSKSASVRCDAALALGISGRKDALGLLVALATDQPSARSACGMDAVDRRTRVFATYGLGCLAEVADDPALQIRVGGAAALLLGEPEDQLELRIAAVSALSLLRLDATDPVQRASLLTTIGRLARFVPAGANEDARLLAHVPPALARLERGTRGADADVVAAFAAHRDAVRKDAAARLRAAEAEDLLLQSEVLALGDALDLTGSAGTTRVGEAAATVDLFVKAMAAEDPQVRYFALLGLGRLGGTVARRRLLEAVASPHGDTDRNWVLLALGLFEHHRRAAAGSDSRPDEELRAAIDRQGAGAANGAWPLAAGLARCEHAVEQLTGSLRGGNRHYVCDALALVGARSSIPALRAVLGERRVPDDGDQCARALALLGDDQLGQLLVQRLDEWLQRPENLAAWAALCSATDFDLGAGAALVRALERADLLPLVRAFAAIGLGRLLEREGQCAFVGLGVGCNYRAAVPTLLERSDGFLDRR